MRKFKTDEIQSNRYRFIDERRQRDFALHSTRETIHAQSATSVPTAAATQSVAVDLTRLPLGDNKVTATTPQQGYLYVCNARGNNVGGGAFKEGSWINSANGTWDSTAKLSVQGAVEWPYAKFIISSTDTSRVLTGNGLPTNATTGTFPIRSSDPAYNYDRNPNTIKDHSISYTLPLDPTPAVKPSCVSGGPIGVMTNGVVFFSPVDAENRDAAAHEIQDNCAGHPEMNGTYHYHSLSPCVDDTVDSNLVGYAIDGYGLYGFKGDKEYTNADLDVCHGLTSEVMWNGKLTRIYHYQATHEFPYTIGCFHGTPITLAGGPGAGIPLPPPKP